ncbi:predicted protein [Chaetomium globosum CBS 148.51]|uniref:Uncharacterized protein n=1 Tax=Chaetomium globosum (strain ATCC 6205 / CBS 148.51 / DSM 1962 / NBRC 6347 / NRRL 1970) TaxID=306901 RepID=Q2HED0_CHAGB|nr:uncharacterized protein CHGG_01424 [Chaetomium globosum CBS 148.51]EAQ93189.1 predicted protein [Chaetomium globosum CBS 148.51]
MGCPLGICNDGCAHARREQTGGGHGGGFDSARQRTQVPSSPAAQPGPGSFAPVPPSAIHRTSSEQWGGGLWEWRRCKAPVKNLVGAGAGNVAMGHLLKAQAVNGSLICEFRCAGTPLTTKDPKSSRNEPLACGRVEFDSDNGSGISKQDALPSRLSVHSTAVNVARDGHHLGLYRGILSGLLTASSDKSSKSTPRVNDRSAPAALKIFDPGVPWAGLQAWTMNPTAMLPKPADPYNHPRTSATVAQARGFLCATPTWVPGYFVPPENRGVGGEEQFSTSIHACHDPDSLFPVRILSMENRGPRS